MSKNYLQVELGGEKRGLKFNLGTLRYIGEITDKDPIDFSKQLGNLTDIYKVVYTIVHAGMLSNYDSLNKEADFSEKDINKWIGEWDLQAAISTANAFNAAFTLPEEGSSDTRE